MKGDEMNIIEIDKYMITGFAVGEIVQIREQMKWMIDKTKHCKYIILDISTSHRNDGKPVYLVESSHDSQTRWMGYEWFELV